MIEILHCTVNLNLRFVGLLKLLLRALPMYGRSAGDVRGHAGSPAGAAALIGLEQYPH